MNHSSLDLDVKELQIQNQKLLRAIEEVQEMLSIPSNEHSLTKEFYTVEDCAELKGAAALNTYKSNRFMLPGCGNPKYSVFILGRLAFPHDVVMRWLKVTDSDYLEYAKECGVSVVPDKYVRLAKKALEKVGEPI